MSTFPLEPLEDRLILQRIESENTTSGAHGVKIALPDTVKEKPNRARVIAIGPDVKHVKQGQKVMFAKYAGTEVRVDGKDYLITPVQNILAIDHEGEPVEVANEGLEDANAGQTE